MESRPGGGGGAPALPALVGALASLAGVTEVRAAAALPRAARSCLCRSLPVHACARAA